MFSAFVLIFSTFMLIHLILPSPGPSGSDYGTVLLGILIMQDVLLGLLMALLPNMANTDLAPEEGSLVWLYTSLALQLLGCEFIKGFG